MVANRGKISKVTEWEESDHVDGDLVFSIDKLQEVQDELDKRRLSLKFLHFVIESGPTPSFLKATEIGIPKAQSFCPGGVNGTSACTVPGQKTSYLSELKAGKEVIVVDQKGQMRTAIAGHVKVETRPLILVEAKNAENSCSCPSLPRSLSLFAPILETQILPSSAEIGQRKTAIPVTSLIVGNKISLRVQGGARQTGIEIQEFAVEN